MSTALDHDSLTEFTPSTLAEFADRIITLRHELLCIDEAGADPFAVQHHLIAISHLELAERALKLAKLTQSSALTQRR